MTPPPHTLITTPDVERIHSLLLDLGATHSLGVIVGKNGVGKTCLLHSAIAWHTKQKHPGTPMYFRCGRAQGLRGIRDLLIHLGSHAVEARRGLSHTMLIKIADELFREQKIGMLALDEADSWHNDCLSAFVALIDQLRADGLPVTVVMAGAKPASKWIGACGSGISRTLRIERIAPLDRIYTAAVLRHWSIAGENLFQAVKAKDSAAGETLKAIWKGTGGIMRRLRYLSDLAQAHEMDFTPVSVPVLLEKIDNAQ